MKTSLLQVEGLTVRFGGLTALSNLDFKLGEGDLLGLIGPNGSGKTTCFNAITGLYKKNSGSVLLRNKEITHSSPQNIYRNGITRTFQRLRLAIGLSVFDNLVIGDAMHLNTSIYFNVFRRSNLRADIKNRLEQAEEILAFFNPKLIDNIYQPIGKLSMIDRRRIEVCRALISKPSVLLLDEPSAGMTHEETRDFMTDLMEIKIKTPKLGVILIEHEMNVIERVTDRCIVLSYGKKIAEGDYRDVSTNKDVRAAYLGED